MSMDLLQVVFTALVSLVVLWLLARLMGGKQVSQMTMFDYIIGITIGSIAAEMASELENPIRPLVSMITYGVAAFLISLWTSHSLKARSVIVGKPVVLLDGGILYRENLKKAKLDLSEFLTECRIEGYFDLNQIQTAVFEHNGKISFLPKASDRPATPADLSLQPKQEQLPIPLVLDGVLLPHNLNRVGKEETWLRAALSKQGYPKPESVLLAMWNGGSKLTVFPMEVKKPPLETA